MQSSALRVLLLGFLVLGTSATWTVYNRYVPDFLHQFGAGAAAVGIVLLADSLLGLVLEPASGAFSDSILIPRLGQRLVIIAIAAPVAAIAFALLPLFPLAIPAEQVGQLSTLKSLYNPFLFFTAIMLVAMALFRTPIFSMLGDIFPARSRGQATGIVNGLGAIGTLLALRTSDWLVSIHPAAPFWAAGGSLLAAAGALALLRHDEPTGSSTAAGEATASSGFGPRLALLLGASLLWFMGFFTFQQLLPSHAESVSGTSVAVLTQLPLLVFAFFCVPGALVGDRIGRAKTIVVGAAVTAAILILTYTGTAPAFFLVISAAAGIGWALINSNAVPFLLDESPIRKRGFVIGLYYSTFAASALISPKIIERLNETLSIEQAFLVAPALFLISGVLVLFIALQSPTMARARREQSPVQTQ